MTHTIHKSNNNSGCGGFLFPLFVIFLLVFLPVSYMWVEHDYYKNAEQLQTILKNECGMVYSIDEVARNGENLSLICGLKKNND